MAFKTLFIIYSLLLAAKVLPQTSKGPICANPKCSKPISLAITTIDYNADHSTKLSFDKAVKVKIFAKGAGPQFDLWEVEINNQRGLVSPKFLQERQIFVAAENLVPGEKEIEKENFVDLTSSISLDGSTTETVSSNFNPEGVSKTFDIVEGTTIYDFPEPANIAATATIKQPENTAGISFNSLNNPNEDTISKNDNDIPKDETENSINSLNNPNQDSISTNGQVVDNITEAPLVHLLSKKNKEPLTTNAPEKAPITENKEELLASKDIETNQSNDENANFTENTEDLLASKDIETNQTNEENAHFTENTEDSLASKDIETNQSNEENEPNTENNKDLLVSNQSESNEEIDPITENNEETKTENFDDTMRNLENEQDGNSENSEAKEEDASQTDKLLENSQNNEGLENEKSVSEPNKNKPEKDKEQESDETRIDELTETENIKQVDEEIAKGEDESLTITTKTQIDPDQEVYHPESSSSENANFNKSSQKHFENSNEEDENENVESDNDITETKQERINEYPDENFNQEDLDLKSTSSPSVSKRDANSEPLSPFSYDSSNFIDKNKPFNMITIDLPNKLLHPMDNSQDEDLEPESTGNEYVASSDDINYDENMAEALFEEASLYKDRTQKEGDLFNKYIRDIGSEDDLAIESPYPPGQDPNNPGFFAGIANSLAHLVGFGSPDPPQIVEDDDNIELTPEKLREMYPRRTFEEKRLEQLLEKLAKRDAAEKAACEAGESEPACPRRLQKYEGFNLTDIFNLYNIVYQYDALFYLLISACTVLCFTLGYYFIENKKLDGSLIAKVNELEKALLIANKECTILKEDLRHNKEDKVVVGQKPFDPSDIEKELEKSLLARQELQDKNIQLEKDLEEATDNGLELNKLLNEYISTQSGSETISKTIEHLQEQLDIQREMIANLNASIEEKNIENKNLQLELSNSKKAGIASDKLLAKLRHNIDNLNKDKKKLLEDLDILKSQYSKDLEIKLSENENIKSLLSTKENEIKILQEHVRSYLRNEADGKETPEKIEELIKAGEILATNQVLTSDRNSLREQLSKEEKSRKLLEDNLRLLSDEITKLKQNLEKAEREKQESENRLEVLSNYFKEKESQLQKKIGIQEEIFLKKNIDVSSFQEIISSLQKEVENYKSQNETLQKEIVDQERELKVQLASYEKKYQDHWITARQTERKLEECKQEAAQLRNRLTIVEKNILNQTQDGNSPLNNRLEGVNGNDLSASPLHIVPSPFHEVAPMNFPMPPGAFMAPPPFLPPPPPLSHGVPFMHTPPQLYPGDRRPPPLGRMSSPPPPGYEHSPPTSPPIGPYSPVHYNMRHATPPPPPPPPLGSPFGPYSRRPPASWQDQPPGFILPVMSRGNTSRGRDANLSSGNSSDSNEKSSQHSGQV